MKTHHKQVAIWLFLFSVLLLIMVGLGGYTRLTDSGLSMTTWKPVVGIVPPVSEAEWLAEMDIYKQSPEYKKVNTRFSLQEFQQIFYVEYFHRLLGRIVGVCFLLPLLYFCYVKALNRKQAFKLLGIFALGGLQGVVGWYMVSSGLVDEPHVSHFRLTFHLLLALLIYGLVMWAGLKYWFYDRVFPQFECASLRKISAAFLLLMLLQIALGGFVAGLEAGFIYNSFPLMYGSFLPEDALSLKPFFNNLLYNPVMVQFLHRINAFIVLYVAIALWLKGRSIPSLKVTSNVLFGMVIFQIILGVLTLIYVVPVWLGIFHQVYAFLLFGKALYLYFLLSKRKDFL